jgi:predicted nucleic acid-binding protein
VLAEISEGIAAGHEDLNAVTAAVTQGDLDSCDGMSAAERAEFQGLLRSLGAGEAACIARAHARGGIVVTDDRAARTACGERGIACTGTIGILKACCDDGQLGPDDADLALSRMVDAGFYAPVFRISDLL